jgi:diguanylate cyclase (GGDEF)-like protein
MRDLDTLQSFFDVSEHITRDMFQVFTNRHLYNARATPGLQGLSWDIYIKNDQRAAFEQAKKEEGFPEFQFTERNPDGELVRAAERDDYVIVALIEPFNSNKAALGYDVSSNSVRMEAIARARDTGETIATAPIKLVQITEIHPGFLVFAPVYKKHASVETVADRRANLSGFMVSVIRADSLVEASLAKLPSRDADIYLFDMGLPSGNQLLHYHPSRSRSDPPPVADPETTPESLFTEIYYSGMVEVAGRHWMLVGVPSPGAVTSKRTWGPWSMIIASLFMTALSAIYLQNRQQLANRDPLSGLPLMNLARDRFVVASQRAQRDKTRVAVLFIDLDDFKDVNDTYGHEIGDLVLKQTAERICQTLRAEDTVARISGDEFLAILGDISEQQDIANVAQKINQALSQPIHHGHNSILVGASIGISLFPDDASDLDTLKRLADKAMYSVKNTEKNKFQFINSAHLQKPSTTNQ